MRYIVGTICAFLTCFIIMGINEEFSCIYISDFFNGWISATAFYSGVTIYKPQNDF